jgi:single-strand DNA-binding protein
MSKGMNVCYLLGHLGQDPELRHTTNSSVLNIRMATTERFLKDSQWQERSEWHTVTVWGPRAEALAKLLKKGDKICVEGSLRTRMWESKSGEKHYATDVNASNVILCGSKRGANSEQSDQFANPSGAIPDAAPVTDDDIPF